MAVVGGLALIWWLTAAASGREAYDAFVGHATSWYGYGVMVGLTWAFFQHLFSGLRHFVLDIGAGYELRTNKSWALLLPAMAAMATIAFWLVLLGGNI